LFVVLLLLAGTACGCLYVFRSTHQVPSPLGFVPSFLCVPHCRRQVFGKGSGQLPVHWAAESNHTAIVRYLTSVCLPCGLAIDERGTTPAQAAAKELAFGAEAALRKIEAQPLFFLRFSLRSSFAAALQRGAPGRDGDAGRMRKAHSYIEGASTTEGAAT
jgi:hypothetical protein